MDEHGNLQLRAFFKQRIEDGIVGMDAFAVRILQVHAEILEDFQALRAVAYIGGKALRRALAVSGSVDVGVARIRKDSETVGVWSLNRRHRIPHRAPGATPEVPHYRRIR